MKIAGYETRNVMSLACATGACLAAYYAYLLVNEIPQVRELIQRCRDFPHQEGCHDLNLQVNIHGGPNPYILEYHNWEAAKCICMCATLVVGAIGLKCS